MSHTHHIHVDITNRTARLSGHYSSRKLIPHWSFQVPQWHFIKERYSYWDEDEGKTKYRWDGKIKFFKYGKMPAGLFYATYRDIEKEEHVKFKIHHDDWSTLPITSERHWLVSDKHEEADYRYQNKCVDKIIEKMYKGGGLILSATGTGKTRMAAMLASRLKCQILFVVDELVLLEQARDDIAHHLGEEIGKVGESKFHPKRVTVATIQTLNIHRNDPRFLSWFHDVDLEIIDEIHVQMNRQNFDVVSVCNPRVVLGLTATLSLTKKPIRLKAYSLCGPVIYEFPLQKGVEKGVLSKGVAVCVQYDNSVREIEAYTSKEIYDKKIVENAERNHIISRIVRRAYKYGKYVFVLVDRLQHLAEISDRLHGIPRDIVAGSFKGYGISKFERLKSKLRFEKGNVRVIIASKVFKKGVSVNRVDVIIDAAARQSREDAIQKFGRGVRRHMEKQGLIYFDISDWDHRDEYRRRENRNPLGKAARRRKRALRSAGIEVKDFNWNDESTTTQLFKKAEKWLKDLL